MNPTDLNLNEYYVIPSVDGTTYFDFLDEVRVSGATNMDLAAVKWAEQRATPLDKPKNVLVVSPFTSVIVEVRPTTTFTSKRVILDD